MTPSKSCPEDGIFTHSFKERSGSKTGDSDEKPKPKATLKSLVTSSNGASVIRKYTLLMLCVASFGAGCGFSVFAPFYPQEAIKKGASKTAIGFVFSVFELAMFLGSPIYGNYLSAIGPKRMYTTGILVAGICSITFGFLDKVPAGNLYIALCIINRALEGLGVAAFFTSSQAIIVHYFPDHVGACFAVQETFYAIGMMIAPTIGGALFEAGGFGLPFWVIGALIFIAGITVMVFLPSPEDCGAKQGNIFSLFKSSRILVSSLVILVGAMGSGFLQPTLANHMETYGLSTIHISLTFIVVPGVHALFSPLWGLIIDKWDLKSPIMVLGLIVGFMSYILIGPTPFIPFLNRQLWCVYLGLALFGLTFGCTIVPAVPSLLHGCREIGLPENLDTFGLVCGLFNSVFCLGTFLGPSLGGFMVDNLEFEYSATVIAGLFLIAMVISTLYFCIIGCKNRSHHTGETSHLLE